MCGECLLGVGLVAHPGGIEPVDGGDIELARRRRRVGDQLRLEGRVPQLGQLVGVVQVAQGPPCRAAVVERGPIGETEQHTDASRRGLGTDVGAGRIGLGDQFEPVPPAVGVGAVLHETEGDRAARADRQLLHPRHLTLDDGAVLLADHAVDLAVVVNCTLEHALAQSAHDLTDGEQLLRSGPRAGYLTAVGGLVQVGPRRGEAERAADQGLLDEPAHREDVLGGGVVLVDGPVAHGRHPHRAVTDHPADVDALGHPGVAVEVLGVGLPVPREAGQDRRRGDVLDRLHHRGQLLAVLRLARRERHAAVAHHRGGHAMPARHRAHRVPGQLGVEVGVDVDEARGHQPAGGVVGLCRLTGAGADLHDAITDDGHVGDPGGSAGAVDDRAAANHEVVGHGSPLGRPRGST